MFSHLPSTLRDSGLSADVRTLLLLQKAMQRGLVKTLGDLHQVLKGIVVQKREDIGPFTIVFYRFFLNIDIAVGESLEDAVLRSETFRKWKEDKLNRFDGMDELELVQTFLDQVHLTHYDIKEILDGREIWDNDKGDIEDNDEPNLEDNKNPRLLDKMADYSDLSLEELLERMKEVMDRQNTRHGGGSHWIGTGGISPYGHGGAAKGGIRVGGTGGGKMARRVLNDHNYFPVDLDKTLQDNNVDAALAALKGVLNESATESLDVPETIDQGIKRGGLFLPEMKQDLFKELSVILLVDNGGYSMSPFVKSVQTLFRKMKTRFAHDMETYYFHNTIYDRIYSDEIRSKALFLDQLLTKNPNYYVFIVGDASMAPYELSRDSIEGYKEILGHFNKTVWLNPEPQKYWPHSFTLNVIKELIPMFPLTPRGIEEAVLHMNKKRKLG